MFNKTIKSIILVEALSLIGFFVPVVREMAMAVFLIGALFLIWKNAEYAVYLAVAELIIGSKGHLLYLVIHGQTLSLRMALWLVILSVWFIKILIDIKGGEVKALGYYKDFKYFKYFLLIFVFALLGFFNGIDNGNIFADVFNDFNAWLYLLLIFPFYYFFKKIKIADLQSVTVAALFWSSIKTLFLLYLFSHDSGLIAQKIYRWVRETGVGEITRMQFGFFRIFFQSHIYQILIFFPIIFYLSQSADFRERIFNIKRIFKDFGRLKMIFFLALMWSATILSLSRSNWIGLIAGFALIGAYLIFARKIKALANISVVMVASLIGGILLILLVINFPIPGRGGDLNLLQSLSERLTETEGESAISSRWELLPALWKEIKISPILGKGFGSIVTYKSSDPRVLETNPTGKYATFSFEWGWLDIWLKIGAIGLLVYIFTLCALVKNSLRKNTGLAIGVLVLIVINTFSPYLNHPLGLGFLMIVALLDEHEMAAEEGFLR